MYTPVQMESMKYSSYQIIAWMEAYIARANKTTTQGYDILKFFRVHYLGRHLPWESVSSDDWSIPGGTSSGDRCTGAGVEKFSRERKWLYSGGLAWT